MPHALCPQDWHVRHFHLTFTLKVVTILCAEMLEYLQHMMWPGALCQVTKVKFAR